MGAKKAYNEHQSHDFFKLENHPLFYSVPEMCLPYSVYQNTKGKVFYINHKLCEELEIKDSKTPKFKDKLLSEFNLRILNEFDRLHHTGPQAKAVKPYLCFATRYLQLQHKNNQGRTSGDGRAIWNGVIRTKNKTWDISSRGTGVTSLAPGVVKAGIPLETGNTDYGYSCGLSDLKEIYAAIIMSERFSQMGFPTERILAAIDIGNGLGICIRAGENLIRPAHLFRYLKLGDHFGAKKLLEYVIDRDYHNGKITFDSKHKHAFDLYLKYFSSNFINLSARAKHHEIFIWLDWDGDNILLDGGIIDYGSVRHFGAHHNAYRYDDVERFSTNLNEQAGKAKLIVQEFCQLVDFIKTGQKKSLQTFKEHKCIKTFDTDCEQIEMDLFLQDFSIGKAKRQQLLRWHKTEVQALHNQIFKLKNKKATPLIECEDGKNAWPALNANRLLSKIKTIKNTNDLEDFKTDFTEVQHNIKPDFDEIMNLKSNLKIFEKKFNTSLNFKNDADHRLTTAALLHLVDLVSEKAHKQKFIESCINFGFNKTKSPLIEKIRKLYLDEL